MDPTHDTLAVLRPLIDRGRHAVRNRAFALYAAALVVLAIVVALTGAPFYESGPIVLVGILALAGVGFHIWYWRMSWERNGVLIALANEPAKVIAGEVLIAEGRAALLDERQVELRTRDATLLLTVRVSDLALLAEALSVRCPSCAQRGFPPP